MRVRGSGRDTMCTNAVSGIVCGTTSHAAIAVGRATGGGRACAATAAHAFASGRRVAAAISSVCTCSPSAALLSTMRCMPLARNTAVVGEQARLHLHAAELCFRHPTTDEQLFFRSDPPFRMLQQRCQLGTVTTTTTTTAGHAAAHTSRSASPGSSLAGRPAATLAPRRMCQVAQGSAIAAQ